MFKRQSYLLLLILPVLTMLTGCNSTYLGNNAIPELPDSVFPDYLKQDIETQQEIFAIDTSMIAFIEQNTADKGTEKAKLTALVGAIFDRTALSLSYNAEANTTAQNTFNEGTANCLSLTIMTYAMTQYLGMISAFQDIAIPEFWTRREGNTLINRHINLIVKPRKVRHHILSNRNMTVDFDPQQGMRRFRAKELTKSEIVSNFYANKAADHLIVNEASRAYAYLKAAINENVNNEGAWLNLGVLFSRHQHFDQAEAFYAMALSIKPNFTSAYENLALLYKRQGKAEKSQVLLSRLHKKRQKNPYYHMMLGDIALEANDYELSITHYKKAISLNHKPHEFHFSLAKVYFRLGDIENAHRYLENAKRWAWDRELKRQYSSKISNLVAKR